MSKIILKNNKLSHLRTLMQRLSKSDAEIFISKLIFSGIFRLGVAQNVRSRRNVAGKKSPIVGGTKTPTAVERIIINADRGFTLLEVLVVLAIIGLIMGLVGPKILASFGQAKEKTARLQIDGLDSAIDLFYLDVGRYPTSTEGLSALLRHPDGIANWNGPYLKGKEIPKDPWNQSYVYRVPGRETPYEVVSLGPDGHGDGGDATAGVADH